jgi:hypothetical protein
LSRDKIQVLELKPNHNIGKAQKVFCRRNDVSSFSQHRNASTMVPGTGKWQCTWLNASEAASEMETRAFTSAGDRATTQSLGKSAAER